VFSFFAVATLAQELASVQSADDDQRAPIVDSAGRIHFIVDLSADAHLSFSDSVTAEDLDRFGSRHSASVINMIKWYEAQYSLEHTTVTSWVGNSFSAYLTPEQVKALRADENVTLITEDAFIDTSVIGPPWYDSNHAANQPPYTETSSWGRNAVNGKTSNGSRRIYVIDTGIGFHEDLPSVITRVNASCGTNNNGCPGHQVVGCYSHATHVAGIIGAAYGNKGTAGVNAGAKLYGINIDTSDAIPPNCSRPTGTISSIATGMDYVKWDLIINGGYLVGIVNISLNSTSFAPGQTLNPKLLSLATPYIGGYVYYGAFIAQSAGNNFVPACQRAFGYTGGVASTSDGIMVVGAINYLGQPVTPSNGGFNGTFVPYEPGSNYGACVEAWAPGKEILSTWGPAAAYNSGNQATWQSKYVTYTNYIRLDGTSMASPHIAGVAAYLAEAQNLNSPSAIEAAVRNLFYTTGQVDQAALPVKLVQLP
jgi:hypothetical protein